MGITLGAKKLMIQDTSGLIQLKQSKLHAEARETKIFIFYFPSAGDVLPLSRKQVYVAL